MADLGTLVIKLGVDNTGLESGLRGLDQQMRLVQSQFKLATSKLTEFGAGSDSLRAKSSMLSQQLDIQRQRVAVLQQAHENVVKAKGADAAETQKLETRLNNATAAMNRTEAELERINEAIAVQESSWTKAGETLTTTGDKLQDIGEQLSKVGGMLTASVTVPLLGLMGTVSKFSMEFGDAMAKVSTIADTTKVPLNELSKGIIQLSKDTGVAVGDLAEAEYQAISAGVDTAKSVAFLDTAVKAAKGGFTSTTVAVDGLSTVLNAYGLEAEDVTRISDQMIQTQNYGKTTFGELASSMGKVIPIAASLDVSTEELFASMAVLTKQGIQTSEAVTGLKAAYSNILKPSKEAQDAAKELGIEFNASHLKSVGWAKFLDEIKVATNGDTEAMAKLFGSTEALNSILVLTGKGSQDFTTALDLMKNSAGSTEAAFAKVADTTGEKLRRSFNELKIAGIEFGDAMTPIIEKLAAKVSELAKAFSALTPEQKEMVVQASLLAAALGPVLLVIGKIITIVGSLSSALGTLSTAIGAAGGLGAVFTAIGAAITGPVGIAVAVIAALAAGIMLLWKNSKAFRDWSLGAWESIKAIFASLGDLFGETFSKMSAAFKPVMEHLRSLKDTLAPAFDAIWKALEPMASFVAGELFAAFSIVVGVVNGLLNALAPLADTLASAFGVAINLLGALAALLTGDFAGAWELFQAALSGLGDVVVGVFETIWAFLVGFWEGLVAMFAAVGIDLNAFFVGLWTGIKDFFISTWEGIRAFAEGVWTGLVSFFTTTWTGISTFFSELWTTISTTAIAIWNGIVTGIMAVVAPIVAWFATTWDSIKTSVETIWNGIVTFFTGIWEAIKNVFLGALLLIADLISGDFEAMKTDAESIWNALKEAFSQIWQGIQQIFSGALSFIQTLAISVWTGIQSVTISVWNSVSAFLSRLWENIKTTGISAWNGLKSSVTSIVTSTTASIRSTWDAILNWFRTLPSTLHSIGSDMFTKMKNGVTSTIGQVKTAIENGINDAVSFIKSLPSQAVKWGKDMIQGIVDGINAKLAEVKAAAKRVADAVKDVLGFSVPKEGPLHSYTEWMPHFMQGIADGIEENKYRVLDAMRGLAADMRLGMQGGNAVTQAVGSGMGGISQTINIYSPKALSPSETARKAKIAAQELALEWGV